MRRSSSTFSAIAELEEVRRGCRLLKADRFSGRINEIMASYDRCDEGDYLFVIGEKE